jgi:hypothetical protein
MNEAHHPDELLDRARLGTLLPDEREELSAHLRVCTACALGARVMDDCAAEARPAAGDGAKLDALVAGAVASLSSAEVVRLPAPRAARARATRWTVMLAAACLLVAGLAVARILAHTPAASPTQSLEPPAETSPVVVAPTAPSAQSPEAVPTAPPAATPPRPHPAPSVVPPAAELFARGNDARNRGDDADAIRLYRELDRQFGASPEAVQSRLGLGRLLLDKENDPAGALRQFDRYLASNGPLREEANVGRALALGALGRVPEERAAWQTVLAESPDSIHAARARERLERLH